MLGIFERNCGPESYDIAINFNNLAALYQAQEKYDDAEALYQRALSKEKLLGPQHPDVAFTLNNLAVLLNRQGRRTEASQCYRRALAILEASLEPDHRKLVTAAKTTSASWKALPTLSKMLKKV